MIRWAFGLQVVLILGVVSQRSQIWAAEALCRPLDSSGGRDLNPVTNAGPPREAGNNLGKSKCLKLNVPFPGNAPR